MKFGQKMSIGVLFSTLIEEFKNFSLYGDFALKPLFSGCFDGSPFDRATG